MALRLYFLFGNVSQIKPITMRFILLLAVLYLTACSKSEAWDQLRPVNAQLIKKKADTTITPLKLREDTVFRY